MPGHKKNQKKKRDSMRPNEQAGISDLRVESNSALEKDSSSENSNGQLVNQAASGDETDVFASANSTPRYPSGRVSREGSVSPHSISPRVAEKPPVSPRKTIPSSLKHLPPSPTDDSKTLLLQGLNDELLKQVTSLRNEKKDLTKKLAQLEEQLDVTNEAEATVSESSTEVDNREKLQITESQYQWMEELARSLGDEKDALATERDALVTERQHLEETVSKSRVELEEAERTSTAANARIVALENEVESLVRAEKEFVQKQVESSALIEENASLRQEKEARENHLSALALDLEEADKSTRAAKDRNSSLEEKVQLLITESEGLRQSQIREEDFLSLKGNVKELVQEKTALLKELDSLTDERNRSQLGISKSKHELEEAENRLVAANERINDLESGRKPLFVKIDELLAELDESRKIASELHQERATLVTANDSFACEKRTLEDALKRSRHDLEDVEKAKRIVEERHEALAGEIESLQQANKALVDSLIPEEEFLALRDRASRLSQEKAILEEEKLLWLSEKKDFEADLSKSRQELEEVKNHNSVSQERIIALEKDTERLDAELSRTKKVVEGLELELERAKQENTALAAILADVRSQNEVSCRKIDDLETDVNQLVKTAESYKSTVVELRQELVVAEENSSDLAKALETERGGRTIQEEESRSNASLLDTIICSLKEELEYAKRESTEASALVGSRAKEYGERVECLENVILGLQHDLGVSKSKATEVYEELATKSREWTEKLQERETEFSSLQEELEDAKARAVAAAEGHEIDKGMLDLHVKKLMEKVEELTDKVLLLDNQLKNEAADTQRCKDDEQALLSKIAAANTKHEKLEADLRCSATTIRSLEGTIAISHVKCEELLNELTELKNGRHKSLELNAWQSQVKNLEETLENAKCEREKQAKLYEELELAKSEADRRTETTKYILPAATATGALVATGLMLILKAAARQ